MRPEEAPAGVHVVVPPRRHPARHLCVIGNIGAGKTTLSRGLARGLHAHLAAEELAFNPFVNWAYEDRPRWAFSAQVAFLTQAATQQESIRTGTVPVIQDRCLHEHAHVFIGHLIATSAVTPAEALWLHGLADLLCRQFGPPDLVIHLDAPVELCAERIAARARDVEARSVDVSYLRALAERYDGLIHALVGAGSGLVRVDATQFDSTVPSARDALCGMLAPLVTHTTAHDPRAL